MATDIEAKAEPLTHDWIWLAIDTVARRRNLTPSALARLAGLDPTAFNRSKRFTSEGRPRWPSTESIAKVLQATDTTLDEFAAIELTESAGTLLPDVNRLDLAVVPIVGEIRDAAVTNWEPMRPSAACGPGRARTQGGGQQFAIAVADASLEPVYSCGNTLLVSEGAEARPGDRIVVKPAGMRVLPRILVSKSPHVIELGRFDGEGEPVAVRHCDIDWMARIVLASQ